MKENQLKIKVDDLETTLKTLRYISSHIEESFTKLYFEGTINVVDKILLKGETVTE